MKIRTMLKCLCIITVTGIIGTIGAYSLAKYGIYESPKKHTKRLNCEDLDRCNLKTKEVFFSKEEMKKITIAGIKDFDEGNVHKKLTEIYNDEGVTE